MRSRLLAAAFLAAATTAIGFVTASSAALKKYDVEGFTLAQFENSSPKVRVTGGGPSSNPDAPPSIALIDDSAATPVLVKYLLFGDTAVTTVVPELSGFVWFSTSARRGPPGNLPGTGSTAASIDWGNVGGWTLTGGTYCFAVPSLICQLAQAIQLATIDPTAVSTNFDLATWTFHGTGFIQSGYITFTNTTGDSQGNNLQMSRGSLQPDGTVPAVPLLGIGAIGVSLCAVAAAAMRRRVRGLD